MSKTIFLIAATLVCVPGPTASIRAQEKASHPDFTGVYYPANPNAAARGAAGASRGAAAPPRPVAVIDGRDGRPATAPKLTPEYLAKWEVLRKSRMAGSSETDPNANCLSAGMPSMMGMGYGMEIQHTKDKITIYGELNDVYRRIFLDGRKPSQRTLDDPTFAGYSMGHWDGDTLVVDTVAVRDDTLLDLFSPHSDQMTVGERIRLTSPGVLEDRVTTTDPKALLEPFVQVRTYRKASPPNDELREFSCAEGLKSAK
jgi:hypothetical protein